MNQQDYEATDSISDNNNCGAVGFVCPPGTLCQFGICVPIDDILNGILY